MNFAQKIGEPDIYASDIFDSVMLNDDPNHAIQRNYLYIRNNIVKTDSTFSPIYETHNFYDIGR